MSLPGCEQRALDGIETDLEGGEPRLRSMFAIFTRLTRDEEAPLTESLQPGGDRFRDWPRSVIGVSLIVGLVALVVFLCVTGSAAHGCPTAVWQRGVTIHTSGCPSAG